MNRLHSWLDRVAEWLFRLSLLAGALMMFHVTLDILGRWLFNHPLPGTTEATAAYYMVAVAFLPLAVITRDNSHISVELFTQQMRPAMQRHVARVVDAFCVAYLSIFTWQGFVGALSATEDSEVWEIPGGFLPVWPMRWTVPAAGLVMTLYVLLRLIQGTPPPTLETDAGDQP